METTQKLFEKIKGTFNEKNSYTYILIILVVFGTFLRTYQLREWLYFYPDQARDLIIVEDYLSGKSDLPLLGFKAASTNFQLGAMYSYFQIISAKIFGVSPATVAYPDVLFGVLSIPLLYYFLKKYFSEKVSLFLTGLYTVSFYAIRYARFAWNSNPIPFFVLLFLLALLALLVEKEKTSWKWIVALGIALGVGVQLHTVLLILLPVTSLGIIIYHFIRGSGKTWKKWLVVFLIAIVLNVGQIVSEMRSEFRNTRQFIKVLSDRSPNEGGGIVESLALNVICNSQANLLYLSSFENKDECYLPTYLKNGTDSYPALAVSEHLLTWASLFFGFVLFGFGYLLLWHYLRKEEDEKRKIFLVLNFWYGLLTFLVILPIVGHNGQVRYWLPIIFLPFVFLGLIGKYLSEKIPRRYYWFGVIPICFLVGLNILTINSEVQQLLVGNRSNAQYVVLGELENIKQYIISDSQPQKEAYIFGGQKYMQNFYRQLSYMVTENDFNLIRGGRHLERIPTGEVIYFIDQNPELTQPAKYVSTPAELGFKVLYYKNFGNIAIFRVAN